ncbi:hypothetical protein AWC38_SpisGene18277 [Stylophora pistillata]|uniref:Uncharacterized protein n=1 Tax=Stylophora pistillata TaxID=50429 RepID=A0A2B4RM54_STYPI|nr:hypothetical protein AWC38_SpisGene18277 [Stylophora pistillata]
MIFRLLTKIISNSTRLTIFIPSVLRSFWGTPEALTMDRSKHGSVHTKSQENEVCDSCELSSADKEMCKAIGRILARIGDRVNSSQMLSNGRGLYVNCRNGHRLDDDTRPWPGERSLHENKISCVNFFVCVASLPEREINVSHKRLQIKAAIPGAS